MKLLCVMLPTLLVLVGCSKPVPSERDIEQAIKLQMDQEIAGEIFAVENVEKLNGYEEPPNKYVASIKFDLVFLKGHEEVAAELQQQLGDQPLPGMAAGIGMMALQMQFGQFEKGQRVPREQEIRLVDTEKGWRILDPKER